MFRPHSAFTGNHIDVYYHGTNILTDSTSPAYSIGGISFDMWTDASTYTMSVSNAVAAP